MKINFKKKKENEQTQNEQSGQKPPSSQNNPLINNENFPLKLAANIDFNKFHINYKVIEENKEKSVPRTKYNKSLNKFIPYLQFKRISLFQPDIINYRKQVENIILQNLTEIRRWYQYSNRLILESEENRLKREEKIYSPQEIVYTNKIYLCMELKDLWRILRDSGIMAAPFSLSCFNRIFYFDNYNKTDTIYINQNINEDQNIYKELYERLKNSKHNFAFENQAFILYYYMTENSEMNKYLYDMITSYNVQKNTNSNINNNNEQKKRDDNNKDIGIQNNENKNNNSPNGLFEENQNSENELKYIKTNKTNFDVNNSHNPLLLYQFYNSLYIFWSSLIFWLI